MERVKKGYINIASIWGESRLGVHSVEFSSFAELENTLHKIELVLKGAEVIEMPSDMDEALQFGDTEQEMKRKINEKGKDRINEFAYGWNACRNFLESKIVK